MKRENKADMRPSLSPLIIDAVENGSCEKHKEASGQKEWDPHMFGQAENGIGFWGAVVHLIRSTIGTGILVLPFAFQKVGLIYGVLGCVFTGLLYVSTVHALVFTEYQLCKRLRVRNLSFVQVVEETFAGAPQPLPKFGIVFKSLMYFYYGVPVNNAIYLLILAANTRGILYFLCGFILTDTQAINLIILPLTALCLIPKLKFLVPFSMLTNVFTLINVVAITVPALDLRNFRPDLQVFGDVRQAPQFFALVLQSLYATGIVLPLKNDMQKPAQFSDKLGVMNIAFFALISLYTLFGLIGYLNYGALVRDNILLNLPEGTPLTSTVYLLYALALSVTYTLIFYVYYDTLWTNVVRKRAAQVAHSHQHFCAVALRLMVSAVAYVMALAIPNFGLLSSIVGTVGIIIEITLPAILQSVLLLTCAHTDQFHKVRMICKNGLVILLALPMCAISLKMCISDIITLYE